MATTIRGFQVELYLEHLEEASFLYEQKVSLPADPEIHWRDLRDFEERLEAHLDALVVGSDLALEVCRDRAREGDAGEVHAAVRVFCRNDRRGDVEDLFETREPDDEEVHVAIRDALRWEFPSTWEPWLTALAERSDAVGLLCLEVLAYHRRPLELSIHALPPTVTGTARGLTALGRWPPRTDGLPWDRLTVPDDPAAREAFFLAQLRWGLPVDRLSAFAASESPRLLGLVGGAARVTELLRALDRTPDPDFVLALSLLGDPRSVEPLIGSLAREELAETAALALYAITGAPLFESQWVPDDDEDPELAPGEASSGERIVRLSTNDAHWSAWWVEHGKRFERGVPHRLGEPYSPRALWRTLTEDLVPHVLRKWAVEETCVRYGFDSGLEVDQDVREQERRLEALRTWVEGEGATLPIGRWTYAGRELPT